MATDPRCEMTEAEIRADEREKCCKAICEHCNYNYHDHIDRVETDIGSLWRHFAAEPHNIRLCGATEIRECAHREAEAGK